MNLIFVFLAFRGVNYKFYGFEVKSFKIEFSNAILLRCGVLTGDKFCSDCQMPLFLIEICLCFNLVEYAGLKGELALRLQV